MFSKKISALKLLPRVAAFILMFACSFHSQASDAFMEYTGDLLLSESYQARQPFSVICYTDSEHGPLLKSVLDPNRAQPMVVNYFENLRRGATNQPDVPRILLAILQRYENHSPQTLASTNLNI
jgi:hypothetical protein